MCDPVTLALLVGGMGASVIGTGMTAKSEAENAQRIAAARNKELLATQRLNKPLGQAARDQFTKRIQEMSPDVANQNLVDAESERDASIQGNLTPVDEYDLGGGSTPDIVQNELSKKLAEVSGTLSSRGSAAAKLGSYGDFFGTQARENEGARRNIGTEMNLIRGNMAILPDLQDYAQIAATKPVNPLGGILSALGGLASGAAGNGFFSPKPKWPDPYSSFFLKTSGGLY